MKQGFVKVAAVTPDIRVADVEFNKEQICRKMDEAAASGAKIIVFPELCVTGYTCSDLFTQDVLLQAAKQALLEITEFTREKDMLVFVGVPLVVDAKLYNVALMIFWSSPQRKKNEGCYSRCTLEVSYSYRN